MKIFVYGTLRHQHPNSKRFGLIDPIATDVKLSGFDLFDLGWYPGIVPGSGTVVGDVFEIDPSKQLEHLDAYEGYPTLYRREVVDIEGHGQVSTYVYNNPVTGYKQIMTGNWYDTDAAA